MHSPNSRRSVRPKPAVLRLPTKRAISYFREKRLLTHLHEQLVDQLDKNPNDWQLHFQLANLLAFTDDPFCNNKNIDLIQAETHYQKSLNLIKQLHEQDYIMYQNNHNLQFESINTPNTPNTPILFSIGSRRNSDELMNCGACVLYENQAEEKRAQPKMSLISPHLFSDNEDSLSLILQNKAKNRRKKHKPHSQGTKSKKLIPSCITVKKRRKKRKQNKNSDTTTYKPCKIKTATPPTYKISPPTYKIKKRKLLIAIHTNDDQLSRQIKCTYSSPMSQDEIDTELEKKRSKNKGLRLTAKYLSAVARLNKAPKTHRKRPSIIMMFNPNSPQNNGGKRDSASQQFAYSNNSPISVQQSESETVTACNLNDGYVVPAELNKGYTECFFGYGKYLCQNKRVKEGIHNLLDCASWYNDSFVDPSCLTSLVLPPQFLFQDSVKKRHCINFRTLSKYISKLLGEQYRTLDKQFKSLNMTKYMKEYDRYLREFEEEMDAAPGTPMSPLAENGPSHRSGSGDDSSCVSPTSSNGGPTLPTAAWALTRTLRVKLNGLAPDMCHNTMLNTCTSVDSMQSDVSLSYQSLLTPVVSPYVDATNVSASDASDNYNERERNKNKAQLINYGVYPQNIRDLVSEYCLLCRYFHRLGLLLTDFLRYADAKRTYGRALQIFRKLKIKPRLYDDILTEVRMTQRSSIRSTSHQERAQLLAQKHKGDRASRSNMRAPVSPSFEFSFSSTLGISPFLIKAK